MRTWREVRNFAIQKFCLTLDLTIVAIATGPAFGGPAVLCVVLYYARVDIRI